MRAGLSYAAVLAFVALHGCQECPAGGFTFVQIAAYEKAQSKISDTDALRNYKTRFKSLSQIESGDNDMAKGKDGERGRYQETEKVWREYNPPDCWQNFGSLTNSNFALAAAQGVMAIRVLSFKESHHREPTDFEWYLLWHRPARVLNPEPAEAERARRFANLCKQPS